MKRALRRLCSSFLLSVALPRRLNHAGPGSLVGAGSPGKSAVAAKEGHSGTDSRERSHFPRLGCRSEQKQRFLHQENRGRVVLHLKSGIAGQQ